MQKQKRLFEVYVSAFVLAVSAYLLQVAHTSKIRTKVVGMNAMEFPKVILYTLIALCSFIVIKGIVHLYIYRESKSHKESDGASADAKAQKKAPVFDKRVILSVALILLYAIGWPTIGFILSSFIFMFAQSRVLDSEHPWWQALLVAVGYSMLVYLVFSLGFGVTFPEPVLEAIGM